jgi:hypothetical protein
MSNRLQLRGLDRTLPPIVLVVREDPAPVDGATRMGVVTVVGVVSPLLAIEALPSQGAIFILVIHPIPVALATVEGTLALPLALTHDSQRADSRITTRRPPMRQRHDNR